MIKTGILLSVLLLLVTLQSTFFFLGILKVKPIEWIVFNACAIANFTYLAGFILFLLFHNRIIMHMALLPLFFFGTLGLFVFSWQGMNIIPQISHILMTLNLSWAIWETIDAKDFQNGYTGLLLGLFLFSIFIGFQQNFVCHHQEMFHKIMNPPLLK